MKRIITRHTLLLSAIAKEVISRKLRLLYLIACSVLMATLAVVPAVPVEAQTLSSTSVCTSPPAAGSIVNNPPEIRNPNASNKANFIVQQNCYLANGNLQAPTLRVIPGKKDLVLNLTNKLPGQAKEENHKDCEGGYPGGMAPQYSTNLHFHGLNVSPKCHRDEVVRTVVESTKTFEYKIEIPKNEPPGLYWYHPHVHMQSEAQVLNGLTGAIIVEGIGKFNKRAAQLPERVFVLRDTDVSNSVPKDDNQQPAKDISINSVPIRYKGGGKYDPPAVIQMKQNEEQFWRVANTAADTYFDLQVQYDGTAVPLELVAMDGVPINANYKQQDQTKSVQHIMLPPAGRAEFIITGPGADVKDAKFLTLNVDTGPDGDNDPQRTIALIERQAQLTNNAELLATTLIAESNVDLTQVSGDRFSGLTQEKSIKERKLYFSQKEVPDPTPSDPKATTTEFYITVEPNQPKVYNPNFKIPDITVNEGTTEDWIVENRANEVHAFHIHQIHFLVLDSPDASEIGMLRDTINIPVGKSVKLRMDFRGAGKDKNTSIAGTFVYHCHILEHEDNGMMAPIEVKSLSKGSSGK